MSSTSSNVFINLITDYQNKGAKDAESSLNGLQQLATKAAKAFAGSLSFEKGVQFGKASVDAFAADQKALALLDQSLKNLGLSLSSPDANKFIEEMSSLYGVTKDDLIPAFQTLLRYTGSVGDSQKLTQLAMDVAAGTGKDLTTVSLALGKAYGGNVTSLSKLGTGLTKAELSSKNFLAIQARLTTLFKGDAAVAADTAAGKIDKLSVAYHEMEVRIGSGLVNAFTALSGKNGSIDSATQSLLDMGTALQNDLDFASKLLEKLHLLGSANTKNKDGTPSGFSNIVQAIPVLGSYLNEISMYQQKKINETAKKAASSESGYTLAVAKTVQAQQATAKLARDNAAAAATAAADAKKKLAIQSQDNALAKAALALKQSQKVFDQQAAELWAATHSKQTDADQQRLQLMNDQAALQDAIDQKDGTLATQLASRVTQEQNNIKSVQDAINSIGTDSNPLQAVLDALDQGKMNLVQMVADYKILTGGATILNPTGAAAGSIAASVLNPELAAGIAATQSLASSSVPQPSYSVNPMAPSWADPTGNFSILVQIGDQAVTDAVVTATQNASATGSQISTSRLNSLAIGG